MRSDSSERAQWWQTSSARYDAAGGRALVEAGSGGRAAASFATRTASTCIAARTERRGRRGRRRRAVPLTFFTGVVIAVETARTAVSALVRHRDRAVGHRVELVELVVHAVDRPRASTITGSRSRSEPLMNEDRRANVPPMRMSMYASACAARDEERRSA